MRNNLIFLIFYLIIGCSPKINLELDIEDLKKEGETVFQNNNLSTNQEEFFKISKVSLYPIKKNIINWNYPNFSSSNLIPHVQFDKKFSIYKNNSYFVNRKKNIYKKEILTSNGKIVYIDDESNLFILDENLKLMKKLKIYKNKYYSNYSLKFSMVISNSILYVADNLGAIFAYNLNDGKILWKNNLGVPFLSNLAISQNNIFTTNSNGKLYSFDILTGKQNWSYETGTDVAKSYGAYKMGIFNDKLVFSNDFGTILCLDLSQKKVIWKYTFEYSPSSTDNNIFEVSNIVLENNSLYISSTYGKFLKLDLSSGRRLWSGDISSSLTSVLNVDTVSIISKNGFFHILEKSTGKPVYKKNIINLLKLKKNNKKDTHLNNIFLASEIFYITTSNGYIFLIDSSDLESVQYKKISQKIISNIAILNNKAFFIGNNGTLFKIQ